MNKGESRQQTGFRVGTNDWLTLVWTHPPLSCLGPRLRLGPQVLQALLAVRGIIHKPLAQHGKQSFPAVRAQAEPARGVGGGLSAIASTTTTPQAGNPLPALTSAREPDAVPFLPLFDLTRRHEDTEKKNRRLFLPWLRVSVVAITAPGVRGRLSCSLRGPNTAPIHQPADLC
jgi:hypothetical protein